MMDNASKRDLIGRTIVDVEWRRFATGLKGSARKDGTDPVLILDNGTRVSFETQETEVGVYGTSILVAKRVVTP